MVVCPGEKMNIAAVFPGQASMNVSLARTLLHRSKNVQKYVSFSSSILNYSFEECILHEPKQLRKTSLLQPLMTAISIGAFEDMSIPVDFLLGLSLGEIAALSAAGVLSPFDAIRLSSVRGKLMYESAIKNQGGMLAVRGTEDFCSEVLAYGSQFGSIVCAANYGDREKILSGDHQAIEEIEQKYNVRRLPVSGAWHSPLMRDAQRELQDYISSIPFQNAKTPIVMNSSGSLTQDARQIQKNIVSQLTEPMLWKKSLDIFARKTLFLTIGFHTVTGKLIQRNVRHPVLPATSKSAIKALLRKNE